MNTHTTVHHKATAYKTQITRTYKAECTCGWKAYSGTYPAAARAAARHEAEAEDVA